MKRFFRQAQWKRTVCSWNVIEDFYNSQRTVSFFNPSPESARRGWRLVGTPLYMILLSRLSAFEVSRIQIWIWEQGRQFHNFIREGEKGREREKGSKWWSKICIFVYIFKTRILWASLKVLTNGEREGLKVVAFDRSPSKLFTLWDLQTNLCRPHPVRGLKLPSEPGFWHLKSIIVSK